MVSEEQEFQVELDALLQRYIKAFTDAELDIPVIADFVFVVATEDMGDATKGGVFVAGRRGSANYRTVGLLNHALHVVQCHPLETPDE